jgi:hypothetical protein
MKLAILVFFAAFFVDIFWTLCIRRTSEGKAGSAANYSAIIILLSCVSITSFVEHVGYVIPAALGGWLGTFITIKWDERRWR